MINNYELAIRLAAGERIAIDTIKDKKGVIKRLEVTIKTIEQHIKRLQAALDNE